MRFGPGAKALEHRIETWRHRAKRAGASRYAMEEGDLFIVLNDLVHFGVGAIRAGVVVANSEERRPACAEQPTG